MIGGITDWILGLHGWVAVGVVFLLPALESSAFVGFVFPGEIGVLLGGVLASQHQIGLGPVLAAGVAGALVGDSIGYEVGQRWGHRLLQGTLGRFVKADHLERAQRYLRSKGGKAVFFGRFTAALRVLIPGLAGMSGMPYGRFFLFNAAGGAVWASGFVLGGYVAGDSWREVEHVAGRASLVLLLLVVLVVAVVVTARWAGAHQDRVVGFMTRQVDRPRLRRLRARYERPIAFLGRRIQPNGAFGLSLTVSLAAVVGAGWILGALLRDVVVGQGSIRFDRPVLEWFAHHREPWLTTAARVVTVLGSSGLLIPLVLAVSLWYRRRHRTGRPLVLLGTAYGGAYLLSQAIKDLVGRSRPPAALAVEHFPGHAFPSGHATQAAAVYGMLAVVVASGSGRWRRQVAAWATAVLITAVVGITRLYLGAHWLTDVLGGWALGTLWFLLVLATTQTLAGRRIRLGPAKGVEQPTMKRILLASVVLAVVTAACGGGKGHSDTPLGASTITTGARSGAPGASRTIDVTMVDIGYQPTSLSVSRGERVEFVFHNQGKIPHDAFIGDEMAQTEHEKEMRSTDSTGMSGGMHDQGGITVEPGTTGSLTYTFDKPGPVEIGCHQPGHYAAGMKVTVTVA